MVLLAWQHAQRGVYGHGPIVVSELRPVAEECVVILAPTTVSVHLREKLDQGIDFSLQLAELKRGDCAMEETP